MPSSLAAHFTQRSESTVGDIEIESSSDDDSPAPNDALTYQELLAHSKAAAVAAERNMRTEVLLDLQGNLYRLLQRELNGEKSPRVARDRTLPEPPSDGSKHNPHRIDCPDGLLMTYTMRQPNF